MIELDMYINNYDIALVCPLIHSFIRLLVHVFLIVPHRLQAVCAKHHQGCKTKTVLFSRSV